MRLGLAMLVALALAAQETPPLALVRGNLLEVDPGEISVRVPDYRVFRFRVDEQTFIEKDNQRISLERLSKGDGLEIVCDRGPELGLRYARLVKVAEAPRETPRPAAVRRPLTFRSPYQSLFPRGNLTFTGVVLRVFDDRFVLRTRLEGEKTLVVRSDTHYMEEGRTVDLTALRTQTRVFVRAGKNLDGELEAYSITWGEIVDPRR